MRKWQLICRLKVCPALFKVGLVFLVLPISSLAQNTVTQTLDVTVVPLGGLFMQSAPLALTRDGNFQWLYRHHNS